MRHHSKNEDIEALRAIAVALVVLCHAGELFRPPGALNALLRYVDYWGGVDIFFCVSGFVIAGSLLRKDDPTSFRALAAPFYIRRIFRIWPAAFLWLAVAVAAAKVANTSGAFGPFRADFREAIAAVLQVHNIYLGLCHMGTLAPCGKETIYWSLSLEEQFYVLFPLLLYFVGPARLRWILAAAILIQLPLHREAPQMLWLTRTDSISYGVLIAIATARGDLQAVQAAVDRHPLWARLLGILLVTAVAGLSLVPQLRIGVGLIALASAGLVLLASGDPGVIIPRSSALRAVFLWAGSRSFGIYLVHHLCFWAAREIFYRLYHGVRFDNSVELGLTGLGLTVLIAEVSYRLLETPIREYGHRLAVVYTEKTDRTGSAMKAHC